MSRIDSHTLRALATCLKSRKARAGFTLVELLIGMVLASIVIGGSYLMFSSSSEIFHHQELNSSNHNNIRFAVEIFRRDVERAGFLATPNAAADAFVCPKPGLAVPAIQVNEDQTVSGTDITDFTADQVFVVGHMANSPPLYAEALTTTAFDAIAPTGYTAAEFEAEYEAPRLVRVMNPDGIAQFAEVDSVDSTNFIVNLDSGTPLATAAGASCGISATTPEAHTINPVTGYVYYVRIDPNDSTKTDLVRGRVSFDATSLSEDTNFDPVVVAEYVVGFEVMVMGVANASIAQPEVNHETAAQLRDLSGGMAANDIDNFPERARYIVFKIATRTARGVPRRLAVPTTVTSLSTAEQMWYEMADGKFAEVRTIQGRVELPNLMLRNMH